MANENQPVEGESAESASENESGRVDATEPEAAAAEPVVAAEPAVEPEDKRARRAAESERDEFRSKLQAIEAQLAERKPVDDLFALANSDPTQFIIGVAKTAGLTPERVLETIVKSGTGEPAALSTEEKLARLEARWAEREKRDEDERKERQEREARTSAEATRKGNVSVTADFLKANAKEFPALDEGDADAVYETVEALWAERPEHARPKDQPALMALYKDAAKRVDAAARAEAEKRAVRLGYSKGTTVTPPPGNKPFKGLTLDSTAGAATAADAEKVHSDDDILEIAKRMFA